MSPSLKYALSGTAAVAVAATFLWPLLDAAGRNGVLLAAAIALPVQIIAFAILFRFREGVNGFLAAWVGGTALRMLVIAGVSFAVIRSGMQGAVPMLLALAGFFFGLLLLEPVFFRPRGGDLTHARGIEA
ncbi:MAG: hypothetical protein OEN56_10750 [Gemmatimonadota bacterium]|nr:hypothetical protein [Gemmatimonadota bacterium]MDH3424296.1 hypothetical protein [Gemmatimonadota bacterium]